MLFLIWIRVLVLSHMQSDQSLSIVTYAVCFNVVNNIPCCENIGVGFQGIFGYKGSLNLFVFNLRLSRASVINSSQEGVIDDLA